MIDALPQFAVVFAIVAVSAFLLAVSAAILVWVAYWAREFVWETADYITRARAARQASDVR